jgi:hypothetical protein
LAAEGDESGGGAALPQQQQEMAVIEQVRLQMMTSLRTHARFA